MPVRVRQQDRTIVAGLTGDWKLGDERVRFDDLIDGRAQGPSPRALEFETADLGEWDSSLLTFLLGGMEYCEAHDLEFRDEGLPRTISSLLVLARTVPEKEIDHEAAETSFVAALGIRGIGIVDAFLLSVAFVGEVVVGFGRLLAGRVTLRWRSSRTGPAHCRS